MDKFGQLRPEDLARTAKPADLHEYRKEIEIVFLDGEIRDEVLADFVEPQLLVRRECLPRRDALERARHAFACRVEIVLAASGVLHNGNDVDERLVIVDLVRLLKVLDSEALRRR